MLETVALVIAVAAGLLAISDTRAILDELRGADGPVTSREIAQGVVAVGGQDARDRKFITEQTRRVSKALRTLREENVVRSSVDLKGNILWSIRVLARG